MTDFGRIVDALPALNRSLEFGLVDNAQVQTVLDALTEAPDMVLPGALVEITTTAFLMWKNERPRVAQRILFSCLAWCLKASNHDHDVANITSSIAYMFEKDGQPVPDDEEIHQFAREGHEINTDSWRLGISDLDTAQDVVEFAAGGATANRARYAGGFTPLTQSAIPFRTFRGWLKRLDPAVLNPIGRSVMQTVFPQFTSGTPADYLQRSEHLRQCGVNLGDEAVFELGLLQGLVDAGVAPALRRHRRFAGGDGLLPRGCYSTVCQNALGDDGGTLNRELMAYTDPRIPGLVFVGDSTSDALNEVLGGQVAAMPGYCVTYVLLFAPAGDAARTVFSKVYAEVLEQSGDANGAASAFALETRVDECTIERVIDLRFPYVQEWFFGHFRDGDGHFLRKPRGGSRDFYDMVPTLMDPAIGGNATTHAIGSWMRSSGVNALIYPSARSDANVMMEDDAIIDSHGWVVIDYRGAHELPATELTDDQRSWPDFVQTGAALSVAGGPERGTWMVSGVEAAYDAVRQEIEASPAGNPDRSHTVSTDGRSYRAPSNTGELDISPSS